MPDWRLPPPGDVGLEDRGGEEWEPARPPHRNLAIFIGTPSGVICGVALPIILEAYVPAFKGVLAWIVGFPVGIMGGTTVVLFLLRKLIERPRRKG